MTDKNKILDRIKEFYRLGGNAELAAFLDVTPQTISNWYSRNTLDYDKIFAKCSKVDLKWLLADETQDGSHPATYANYQNGKYGTERTAADVAAGYGSQAGDPALLSIPLYDKAGFFTLLNRQKECKPLHHILLPCSASCDGATYVHDDSMAPALTERDIVFYKKIEAVPLGISWGELHLLSLCIDGQERDVIRCIHKESASHIRLCRTESHDDSEILSTDTIRAIAVVVARLHFNKVK